MVFMYCLCAILEWSRPICESIGYDPFDEIIWDEPTQFETPFFSIEPDYFFFNEETGEVYKI